MFYSSWIPPSLLIQPSTSCLLLYFRSLEQKCVNQRRSTPPDDPWEGRETYLFPLFNVFLTLRIKSSQHQKAFQTRTSVSGLISIAVKHTGWLFIRAETSCRIQRRLITNKCLVQKFDAPPARKRPKEGKFDFCSESGILGNYRNGCQRFSTRCREIYSNYFAKIGRVDGVKYTVGGT